MALATASSLSSKTFVGSNCSADYNQGSFLVDYTVSTLVRAHQQAATGKGGARTRIWGVPEAD